MPTSMPDVLRPRQEFPTPLFRLTLVTASAVVTWVVSLWFR